MNKETKRDLYVGIGFIVVFIIWTIAVKFIDVLPIGPNGSNVGFATLNGCVNAFIGTCMPLYVITDWLGFVPICFAIGFGVLGLMQWCKRKKLLKVDYDLLVLGVFFLIVMVVYFLFEIIVINYRPVLIDGYLEVSYPSSTTMLVLCVMPTTIMQLSSRIKSSIIRKIFSLLFGCFTIFMVIGRLISGVHWFSDIIGGALLSVGLVNIYRFVVNFKK